jgi:hypothetical protein
MELHKGDIVWIDNAPLLALREPTGHTTMCEVLEDSPAEAQQVHLIPCERGASPLYVFKQWLTEPESFRYSRSKPIKR